MTRARVEIHPAPAGAGHARQHVITAPLDHTSGATPGQILQADANGLPVDAANTDAQVALAVGLAHAQGTDTALGAVGVKNPPIDADKSLYRDSAAADALVTSTWTQIKAFLKTYFDTVYGAIALAHNRLHSITSVLDHTSGATPGQILQADANGLPIDAANTNIQVVAAVALAHARQHAITNPLDHTSGATPGRILQADANGLPVDGTNINADVADAVAKKHTQGTDTALGAVGVKNPPIDADKSLYRDSTAVDALVTSTWTQVKAFLKTYFDTLYGALGLAHTRLHSITSILDHSSAATPGKILKADANGLPVDATNTDANVADAVTKKHTQGTDTTLGTLTANVNFAKYKAIAMVCDNGATVPALPVAAQWFLHTPTGRKVLMQYDGSNWIPIISLGTVTMYVDNTDGTDAIDKGGAVDAGAFKTLQYAINIIPPNYSGNIIIYLTAETYSETVTIQGKSPSGAYTITIQGTRTILDNGLVCAAGCLQGSYVITTTHQYAKIIRDAGTWTTGPHQRDKKWVRMTSGAAYSGDPNIDSKLIDGSRSDATSLRPLGKFTNGAPTTGDTFNVEEPGTVVTKIIIGEGQKGITINDIDLGLTNGTVNDIFESHISARFNRCQFDFSAVSSIWTGLSNYLIFNTCYFTYCRLLARGASRVILAGCYVYIGGAVNRCLQPDAGADIWLGDGSIIDANDVASSYGIYFAGIGILNCNGNLLSATANTFRSTVRNCVTGVYASYNGIAISAFSWYILVGDDIMPNAAERATATTASKLVDISVDFTVIGVAIGDKVINLTDKTTALVTAIDSATQLSLDADIMAINEYYRILDAPTLNTTDTSTATGGQIQTS